MDNQRIAAMAREKVKEKEAEARWAFRGRMFDLADELGASEDDVTILEPTGLEAIFAGYRFVATSFANMPDFEPDATGDVKKDINVFVAHIAKHGPGPIEEIECPTCAGDGGFDVDDAHMSMAGPQHFTRTVRCECCKKTGVVPVAEYGKHLPVGCTDCEPDGPDEPEPEPPEPEEIMEPDEGDGEDFPPKPEPEPSPDREYADAWARRIG